MFRLNPKQIQLKKPSIFDIPGFATPEKRKDILEKKMLMSRNFVIKGGTSLTNPYKDIQDVILAERREVAEYFQKSILWSPKYTPWHFKNFFLFPAMGVLVLMLYIRYIAVPRNMRRLKQKGYNFPELEAKGWLDGWLDDDEEEEDMIDELAFLRKDGEQFELSEFEKEQKSKETMQQFQDWTMKDLYNFEKKDKASVGEQATTLQKKHIQDKRLKMQNKLNEFVAYREEHNQKQV